MITKKIKKYFVAGLLLCGGATAFTACSDMLESDSTRQLFEPELNQKTDSVFYALGILQGLQELADQYVFQGEMRGDLTKVTEYTDNNLRQLADFSATTANKYDSAYVYYRVINNCNYYIAHIDTTLHTGADYVMMKEYAAVKAIRAWTYMQLARVYRTVPFYTEPLTQISQINNNSYPQLDMAGIVNALAPDLEQYTGYQVPDYGNVAPTGSALVPGRLFIPVDVVLGDMYLETEQYDRAASHYITYLTKVSTADRRHTAYTEPVSMSFRSLMAGDFELPSDWDRTQNSFSNGSVSINGTSQWSETFTHFGSYASNDIITYIPMADNKLEGSTTDIPKAFGYDFYANDPSFIPEIQIQPSESYLDLVNSTDYYYYSTLSTASKSVFNSAKLGDTRYSSVANSITDSETDSTTVWMIKYCSARIFLYRNTTVLLHLAEAFNRLGMYDAAFAILKDGIQQYLPYAKYISPETVEALQTTYPLLSTANISLFSNSQSLVGVHCHGSGYACDTYGSTYTPEQSPYQLQPVVGKKMQEIAKEFNVAVGTTRQDTINAMEDLLCDEYALELAFEGSRFFDLCRLARHKNANSPAAYGAAFGGQWLAKKLEYKNPTVDLKQEDNWYLPFK